MRRRFAWGVGILMAAGLTAIHFFVVALPPTMTTPLILLDHLWRWGLMAALLWLATAIGLALAARLGVTFTDQVEALPFIVALGLGTMMTIIAWLGFARLFNLAALGLVLAGMACLVRQEWVRAGKLWQSLAGNIIQTIRGTGGITFPQVATGMVGLLLIAAAVPTMAPVDSYDALMYHLPAPAAFIKAGQIISFPQEVQSNYPLGFEMLFSIGLMLRDSRLAQMLHFSTIPLLTLAVYAFTRRFSDRLTGLLAVLVLLASAKVTLIGAWAFTDMAFVFFASLAVYAFAVWWREDSPGWLLLAGTLCGIGLSMKYYGFRPPLALGLALLWRDRRAGRGWQRLLSDTLCFGAPALLIAAPWYIKNWLWLGNPLYPFFLGGANWDTFRAEEWARWVDTFGRGHSLANYLLLPVNIWRYPFDFSATPHGYFNFGLLLAPTALLMQPPGLVIVLWLYIVIQFYLWAVMMQELRYLLLILPWLSLCAGWALARLFYLSRGRRWLSALVRTVPLVLITPTLAIHLAVLTPLSKNPLPVVLGLESPASYLRRANYIYPSMEFINAELPPQARVVYLWEGQTYYCQRDCLPDPIYDRWGDLIYRYQTPEAVLGQLQALGATHLLINHDGLKLWLRDRNPAGPRAEHIAAFYTFREEYLTQLYADPFIEVYRIDYTERKSGP
jgi:4-amino-4-deoxy-L-arabinose transferase-like glycosyltransferase